MNKHLKIVIVGAGSVGTYLVERLSGENHDIVVIDHDDEVLDILGKSFDIQTVHGSASAMQSLSEAQVHSADIIIAATDSDETNLISCLLADSINENIKKIARVREIVTDHTGISNRIANVFDHFINPDSEAVAILLRLVEVPGAVEVMEFGGGRVWVVGVVLGNETKVIGRALRDLPQEYETSNMLIVAIARDGQIIVPRGDDVLQAGDEVYVAARADRVDSIFAILGRTRDPISSVMIAGCTQLSRKLADELSQRGVKVKLIERDAKQCEVLSQSLNDVLILHGDGTDQELLREEGVADVDLFVGAGADEEENILSVLLAKRMGARVGAVVVTKSSYLNLVPELGVDVVVSPNIAAASSMLRFVRGGNISTAVSTRDDNAEVLEIVADPGSNIVGVPLRDLKLPAGVIALAVMSDEHVRIPKGETIISPGDRVIFFANRKALPKLQKILS